MGSNEESVRLQTDLSKDQYERLRQKAPVPADAGKAELMRYVIQRFLEDRRLDELRATGKRPENAQQDSE